MHLLMCVAAVITQLCYSTTLECNLEVMSCDDIKVGNGYKYAFPPNATEVEVYHGKILIAHGRANYSKFEPVVNSMNTTTLIARDCLNLTAKLFFRDGAYVREVCMEYRVIENRPDASQPLAVAVGPTVAVIIGVIGFIGIVIAVILCLCFYLSQGTQHAKPQSAGAFLRINRYLRSFSSSREGISQSQGASSDPETDGGTAVTPSSIQPSNKVTDGNAACNHRAMHRNTRDDPGGLGDNRGGDTVQNREANECSRFDQMEEGKLLLSDQRNPDRGLNVGDEAPVLANKRDFDPDQVSQGSIDVESTPPDGETVI